MTRFSPRLLVTSAALLVAAWLVVPVSTSPPATPAVVQVAAPLVPLSSPEVDEINREVARLSDRLAEPVPDVTPVRDPFQFVSDAPAPDSFDAGRDLMRVEPSTSPVLEWPTLVAILSSPSNPGEAPNQRVALEDRAELVQIRSVGESLGDFVVTAVSFDAATLTHTPTGESVRVPLR